MQVSLKTAIALALLCALGTAIVVVVLHSRSTNQSQLAPIQKTLPHEEATSATTSTINVPPKSSTPPSSGQRAYAIGLLDLPTTLQGKLLTVDAWSVPTKVPWLNGQVRYAFHHFDHSYGVRSGLMGLIFENEIRPGVLIYKVLSLPASGGSFFDGTDRIVEGRVALEMSEPGIYPDTERPWDVEPVGFFEGKTQNQVVVQIPEFRFWKYHDTGENAKAPPVIVIPPQHPDHEVAEDNAPKEPGATWVSSCDKTATLDSVDLRDARTLFSQLQSSLRSENSSQVADLMDSPLHVNEQGDDGIKHTVLNDRSSFAGSVDQIFNAKTRAYVLSLKTSDCLNKSGDLYSLGGGMIWVHRSHDGTMRVSVLNH
jgi:hypothetical protein